jgi:hypothetical protein
MPGPTPPYPAHYPNDVQGAMAATSTGLYTRHRFTVADKSLLASLRLRVKYDDAYVAFLNGVEVARGNFAGSRAYNSVADTDREDSQAVVFEDIDITATALPALVNGVNVLAVHGIRRSLTHEAFLLAPVLEAGFGPTVPTSGFLLVPEVIMNSSSGDSNHYRIAASYDMLRTSGHPACEAFTVAMYRNGTFQSMGVLIEQVDEDYLRRRGHDEDGAMYKFVQRLGETPLPGGDYSNSPAFGDTLYGIEKKTRLHEGMSDLDSFIAGLLTGTDEEREAHLFETLNLPNFINFMAMRPLISDSDTNRKNFYFYRDSDRSREWYLFTWDKDGTMRGPINPWQATLRYRAEASSTKQWNVLWEQGYQSPEIRAMVGRRLRTLMDRLLGPPGTPAGTSVIEQRMAAVRPTMTPLPPSVNVSGYNAIS